jgi:Na+/H+ antiporter NhaD/arsenite permease-like protein
LNFVTAPLIADLFLLAINAIGRTEVHDGTIGSDHIQPYAIMIFFLTLAYIAISIDASGLIRYLAFKVLQKGGGVGHRLFFYLYVFFFAIGSFIGNYPIILSGTAFLAYMTRVSSNIIHPRAWIHTQFAVANIASAILVSSNPTNLVLTGAFGIKFIYYTANMIVPVVVTAIVLFPFLLYIVFADPALIPFSIKMHQLNEEQMAKKPVNPNIPHARGIADEQENLLANNAQGNLLSLEEIMNPFLDKGGAAFGAVIMSTALITLLVLNAVDQKEGEHPAFYVTLPAAVVMFCWDVGFGWYHRDETRTIARRGQKEIEDARAERAIREEEAARRRALEQDAIALTPINSPEAQRQSLSCAGGLPPPAPALVVSENGDDSTLEPTPPPEVSISMLVPRDDQSQNDRSTSGISIMDEKQEFNRADSSSSPQGVLGRPLNGEDEEKRAHSERVSHQIAPQPAPVQPPLTLASLVEDGYIWCQETFPTVAAVLAHLPFALVPFAFSMFVLVQGLVTKGWVPVFAHGWDHWVDKTGWVGAIGGMGFLSVVLCNVSCCF